MLGADPFKKLGGCLRPLRPCSVYIYSVVDESSDDPKLFPTKKNWFGGIPRKKPPENNSNFPTTANEKILIF